MDYKEKITRVEEKIKNKAYESAEQDLLQIINEEEIKNVEDENNTYYTFYNYVETIIFFNRFKPTKKLQPPATNIADTYMKLGFINNETKNFGKAIKYLNKASEWNPVSPQIIFERAFAYRGIGDLERYKAEIEKAYQFIYTSSFMARYYRELGSYYTTKKIYDLANALYTYSRAFVDTELAINELTYIAKQENREPRFSKREEIERLFTEYNIPLGVSDNVVQMIFNESQHLLKENINNDLAKYLYRALYDITLDKKFMLYIDLKDDKTGITLKIPEIWKILNKEAYNKFGISDNTLFLFLAPGNENVSIVCDGKCNPSQLDEAYNLNIENMKKQGVTIEREFVIKGQKNIKQVFILTKQNEKTIRIFQNYLVVNGYLINVSWKVPSNETIERVMEVENNSLKGQMIWSLKGINEDTSVQDAALEMTKKMNELLAQGKTPQEAAEIVFGKNNEKKDDDVINLDNIIKEYSENGINSNLIKLLGDFSKDIIKQDTQDPFWSTMARGMLETLIILNLAENKVDISSLIEQSGDINKARLICKNNVNKLDIEKLQSNGDFINSIKILNNENNDKTLSSILEIVNKALLPYDRITTQKGEFKPVKVENLENVVKYDEYVEDEKDNLKEYSQEIEGYPTFKFQFPKELGEYSKSSANVFEIKDGNIQKIRVMISKCDSEEKLESDAKKWIEKNKSDAKMEEVKYRKERINNIPIEVYILKYINNSKLANKIYKIGYVNNCRITISGGIVKGKEEIINKAFETLTWEENETSKEETKAETEIPKPKSNAIIVKCPVCNNEFKLNWNVPASEKTFYCKCPNCNAEIKKVNPNYKG